MREAVYSAEFRQLDTSTGTTQIAANDSVVAALKPNGIWLLQNNTWSQIDTAAGTIQVAVDPQGRVYALGQGGRMIALELSTGQRLWEQNFAGISTPWIAGDWLFVVTDNGRLVCLARSNGKARWIAQLQRFKNTKKQKGPQVIWFGPVLAGNRLILTNSLGQIVFTSPTGVAKPLPVCSATRSRTSASSTMRTVNSASRCRACRKQRATQWRDKACRCLAT